MNERERFIALLESQKISKGDAIILLVGDGYTRVDHAVHLYTEGYGSKIVITGNDVRRHYGSTTAQEIEMELLKKGIPKDTIYCEGNAQNTRAEAIRAMELSKERGWRNLLIVTSPHHQYRAYLTFLKALKDLKPDISIQNAVAPLSWNEETRRGRRIDRLSQEFDRIEEYQKKGDVASYEDGIAYLKSL